MFVSRSVLIVTLFAMPSVADAGWRAGVATSVITPETPVWMSGYASRTSPAQGTLHDLKAKALVLDDGKGGPCVLVTLDLVGIGRDFSLKVRAEIETRHRLNRSQVALMTSHTHTGPVVGENLGAMYFFDDDEKKKVVAYTKKLRGKIIETVDRAFANLEPVSLSYGVGATGFAVNRRNNREPDVPKLRERNMLRGPVDHRVPVLAVRTSSGTLKAVLFGYACHATTLSFMKYSGDWPGFAQIAIEKKHPECVALFWAGCGADQNPLPRRMVALAERYGKMAAQAVDEVLTGEMTALDGEVATGYQEIPLGYAAIPTAEELKQTIETGNRYESARATLLMSELNTNGAIRQTYPYPVQVWRFGRDIAFVILGGEVVVDFALRLPQEITAKSVWVAGYANDVMAYIPSKRVLLEGGYEGERAMVYYGLPSKWNDRVEEDIVGAVKALAARTDRILQQERSR